MQNSSATRRSEVRYTASGTLKALAYSSALSARYTARSALWMPSLNAIDLALRWRVCVHKRSFMLGKFCCILRENSCHTKVCSKILALSAKKFLLENPHIFPTNTSSEKICGGRICRFPGSRRFAAGFRKRAPGICSASGRKVNANFMKPEAQYDTANAKNATLLMIWQRLSLLLRSKEGCPWIGNRLTSPSAAS